MEIQIEDFKSLNFTNKKAKQHISELNYKSSVQLLKTFIHNSNNQNKINTSKQFIGKLTQQKLKKVASEVQFLGYDKDYCMIFGIYGPNIDVNNKEQLKFTINQIIQESFYSNLKHNGKSVGLKKYSTNGISLVFFNNMLVKKKHKLPFVSSREIYQSVKIDDFKQDFIKQLCLKNLIKINQIILVFPSLLTKSWNYFTSFGVQNSFYDTYFTYIDSIYELVEKLGPLFNAQNIDSKVLSIDSSSSSKNWKLLFSAYQKSYSLQQFESYEEICESISQDNLLNFSKYKYRKSLDEYPINQNNKIPFIIELLVEQIRQNHLRYQGIFRKVADQSDLIKLQNIFQELQRRSSLSETKKNDFLRIQMKNAIQNANIQTLTSFLKKILMQVQNPLVPDSFYRKLSRFTDEQIQKLNVSQKSTNKSQIIKKRQSLCQSHQPKDNQIVEQKIIPPKKKQFIDKIAFFQNLTNKKSNQGLKQVDHKTINVTKISFKVAQNGKKLNQIKQIQKPNLDIFNFTQIEKCFQNNYCTFKYLISFLNVVQRQQRLNLMSSHNLAICFVPCFFRFNQKFIQDQSSVFQQCQLNKKMAKILTKIIQQPELYF